MGIGQNDTNSFQGIYDGANNSISKLLINDNTTDQRVGLFKYAKNATIKNLGIGGSIKAHGDAGAIVGYISGTSYIINCYNNATVINTNLGYSLGGLVGITAKDCNVTIQKCSNKANVESYSSAAGIVGLVLSSTLNLEDSYNTGAITSTLTAHTSGTYDATAGLVVKDSSSGGNINITRCYNNGTIKGKENVGGLVSSSYGTIIIDSCYNMGHVEGTNIVAGILALQGKNSVVTIKNSYTAGTLTATSAKGGIIGKNNNTTNNTNYTTAYYLNTTATTAMSNVSDTTNARTDSQMKAESFATSLGSNFKYVSGSYPKLVWE